jgi:hypothetical protein
MTNDIISKKDIRVNQVQHVLMLLFQQPDISINQACEQVGINEDTYRYWLAKGDDSIDAVRDFIDQQQRELISEIAVAKGRIVRMLINDATDVLTKPLERKALFESLSEELDELQTVYNVRPGIEEDAQAFLKKGPSIEKKQSRFASIDIEETDSGFRIGLNESKDIIDGETIED